MPWDPDQSMTHRDTSEQTGRLGQKEGEEEEDRLSEELVEDTRTSTRDPGSRESEEDEERGERTEQFDDSLDQD